MQHSVLLPYVAGRNPKVWVFGVFFPFLPLSNPSRVPLALQPHLINIHMHTATFIHARLKEKQVSFTFHNKFFFLFFNHRLA